MHLLVNVATKQKYVMFFDRSGVTWSHHWDLPGQESKEVLAAIRIGERTLSCSMDKDIKQIICIHGPGPFTSLRVAVSVLNAILYLYPHIQGKMLTTGKLFAILDGFKHQGYLFQPYPSDYFFFDQEGEYIKRDTTTTSVDLALYAGDVITDTVHDIPHIDQSSAETMELLSSMAVPALGIITPFYAKEPNITKPKHKK